MDVEPNTCSSINDKSLSIPETRAQAVSLLSDLNGDLAGLNPEQRAAIRDLYGLDDPRSVEELESLDDPQEKIEELVR